MSLYGVWKNRAYIRITSPAATANFVHTLSLTWLPGMQRDFRDIRFTTLTGLKCSYFLESFNAGSSATVAIKIPLAAQPGIYLYYGNGQAVDESSGAAIYDFWDDFSDLEYANTPTWSVNSGTWSAATGKLAQTASGASWRSIQATYNHTDIIARADVAAQSVAGITARMPSGYRLRFDTANRLYLETTAGTFLASWTKSWTAGVEYTLTMKIHGTTIDCYLNNDLLGSVTDGTTSSGTLVVCQTFNTTTATFDRFGARAYPASEPTLTVIWHGVNIKESQQWLHYPHTPVDYVLDAVNIYHPVYPTASLSTTLTNPTDESNTLISVRVSQGMDDAMSQAVFEHDGDSIGGYFSGDLMTQINVSIPDHTDTSQNIFTGIAPSSRTVYEPAKNKVTLTAVDYSLFLTKQVLETKDLVLLPPADQTAANTGKVLNYDNVAHTFQIGMGVTGSVSGANGTVYELVYNDVFKRMTLYPAAGTFINNEELKVGGVVFAYADGASNDVTYSYEEIYPEDWVYSVLGGDNWRNVTGIEPYKLNDTSAYWDTVNCAAVQFLFGTKESKWDAIQRVAKYMGYIFIVKPRDIGGGVYQPAAYFIPLSAIDTMLDLPAAVGVTSPDNYLAAPVTLEQNGESQIDRVKVCCGDLSGNWLTAIKTNSRVDAGEGPFREFYDEPPEIATQTDLDAYCLDMYNLHVARACTWRATFLSRSDLRLYQLMAFSGYGTEIPDGTYRIVRIEYEYGCAVNKVHVTLMLSTEFSNRLRLGWTYQDSISEVQRIVRGELSKQTKNEVGTVTAIQDEKVTVLTDAGLTKIVRDGSV